MTKSSDFGMRTYALLKERMCFMASGESKQEKRRSTSRQFKTKWNAKGTLGSSPITRIEISLKEKLLTSKTSSSFKESPLNPFSLLFKMPLTNIFLGAKKQVRNRRNLFPYPIHDIKPQPLLKRILETFKHSPYLNGLSPVAVKHKPICIRCKSYISASPTG